MMDSPTRRLQGWTIVFDLDGTLVDTAPDLTAALNHVLGLKRLAPVDLADARGLIGLGAKAMIAFGLERRGATDPAQTAEELMPDFLDFYVAHIADHSRPFPGVEGSLAALAKSGATLSVCTNKRQALSEQVLETLSLDGYFAAIVGADAVDNRKPHADHIKAAVSRAGGALSHAIMVGDSDTDAQAALGAGTPFVYAPFGYGPEPKDGVRTDAVLDDFRALPEIVDRIAA